jgi:hypothetical protein
VKPDSERRTPSDNPSIFLQRPVLGERSAHYLSASFFWILATSSRPSQSKTALVPRARSVKKTTPYPLRSSRYRRSNPLGQRSELMARQTTLREFQT